MSADANFKPVERVKDYRVDFTRLLATLFTDLESQIARSDAKANLIITANSILFVIAANFALALLRYDGALPMASWLLVGSFLPMVLLSGIAIESALSTAYPRDNSNMTGSRDDFRSLFFSGDIAALSRQQYVDQLMDASLDEVKLQVTSGIHAKAGVLQTKMHLVRRGVRFTLWSFASLIAQALGLSWFGVALMPGA